MTTTTIHHKAANKELLVYFLNAFFIVQVLCFIDEGYYDFRWMQDVGNWVVFIIYTGILFGIQAFFAFGVMSQILRVKKRITGIVFGINVLILLLVLSLFTN